MRPVTEVAAAVPRSGVLTRAEAKERYEALRMPATSDEHWRFTNLRGFDPGSFGQRPDASPDGAHPTFRSQAMLDLDVSGRAVVTEQGIEILSAPEGVTFAP